MWCGIEEAIQEHIFELFVRPSRAEREPLAGIVSAIRTLYVRHRDNFRNTPLDSYYDTLYGTTDDREATKPPHEDGAPSTGLG